MADFGHQTALVKKRVDASRQNGAIGNGISSRGGSARGVSACAGTLRAHIA